MVSGSNFRFICGTARESINGDGLSSAKFPKMMESGNLPKLEQAMDDIRKTIEWLLSKDITDYEETNF